MKIIQVVTLFTPDGAYGGPARVAINQTRELRERGHDVSLVGAALGYGKQLPDVVDGVDVCLFPARRIVPRTGFAGLASPGLLSWFRKMAETADVVHVHLARDLVTLPPAAWSAFKQIRYVVQPHGMVDAPSNRMASALDILATRNVLQRAETVLCLNQLEEWEVQKLSGQLLRTAILPNGVPIAGEYPESPGVEVLFLARLQLRKRPTTFVEAALRLAKSKHNVQFSIVGPDEGQATAVERLLLSHGNPPQIRTEGALDPGSTLHRLRECSIYVLPAVNEPFPMSVLEAMSVGKPVILANTCGLAGFVESTNSGLIVDDSVDSLSAAISKLLDDSALRKTMGANAMRAVRDRYGMVAIVDRLLGLYEGVKVA